MEVVMRSVLLFALLIAPVTAQAPSVDQLLQAYAQAGWVPVVMHGEEYACIAPKASKFADWAVAMLAERARGMKCI